METFSELNLSEPIMKAINEMGFEKPTAIQAEALPILLGEPTDFMGLAATGTGKTAAFAIPILERIDETERAVQALVLCPTRELAIQVAGQFSLLGKYKKIKAIPVYGGSSYSEQIYGLRNGAQIVVGTPGRIVDHLNRGTLRLGNVTTVVLDEADEMISMGFKEDMESILSGIPEELSHTWLFSATMGREVRKVADSHLNNPRQVQVNKTEMLASTVEQIYYVTQESNKPEVLCKLIDAADDFYGLIFCQTKMLVTDVTQYLKGRGYKVDCLHGDMSQSAREMTMNLFRDHKLNMLVCTDVASRGLDVRDMTHVVNYSIPREMEVYVHRIGRTARSGKSGFALSLVTNSNRVMVDKIERMTKSEMKEGKIPGRKEIGQKKIARVLSAFQCETKFERAVELLDPAWQEVLAGMTATEIAGRFMSMMFPEVFSALEKNYDVRPERAPRERKGGRPPRGQRNPYAGDREGGFERRSSRDGDFRGGDDRRVRARGDRTDDRRGRRSDGPRSDFSPAAGVTSKAITQDESVTNMAFQAAETVEKQPASPEKLQASVETVTGETDMFGDPKSFGERKSKRAQEVRERKNFGGSFDRRSKSDERSSRFGGRGKSWDSEDSSSSDQGGSGERTFRRRVGAHGDYRKSFGDREERGSGFRKSYGKREDSRSSGSRFEKSGDRNFGGGRKFGGGKPSEGGQSRPSRIRDRFGAKSRPR